MTMSRWLTLLSCVFLLVLSTPALAQDDDDDAPPSRLKRVGVVFDGPAPRGMAWWKIVRKEIESLVGNEFDVQFPEGKQLVSDWKPATIESNLDRLLNDPEIDMVITFGVIGSNEAVQRRSLPKPTVAPFVLNPYLQGLAGKKKRRVGNLSFLIWALDLKRDLKIFSELGDFTHIALLANAHYQRALPVLFQAAAALSKEQSVQLTLVPVESDVSAAVAKIPAGTEAVYVAPNMQLTGKDIEKLGGLLIERKLPSFSWVGRSEVEHGLLMGLGAPSDVTRLSRRLALNVQAIFLGDEPASLVTAFKLEERLVMNMGTARAIGVSPNWALLTEADLINPQRTRVTRTLSLSRVVREAQKSNIDLRALRHGVLAGAADIDAARAALLPRLEASITGSWIDSDRAGLGNAERTIQWSAQLQQLLYSERVWANYSIQKDLQHARVHQEKAQKLDVIHAAAVAYFNVLRTKTGESVTRENVQHTRENLALARVRQRVGTGRRHEVLRWESAIASARRDLIQSVAQRNLAEMKLNRILNRPIEEPFIVVDTKLEDTMLMSGESRFRAMLNNPRRFRIVREFMVREGLRGAPELKQLGAWQKAKAREVDSNRLAPFVPTFALQTGVTHRFIQNGAGTDPAPSIPGISFPDPNNFDWQVGVTMSLPLFEGGERYARTRKSEHEQGQLKLQEQSARQKIDERVRGALHNAGASLPGIRLAREAARAATETHALVKSAYSQGAASILDLLDAQTQALTADLAATNATYLFLVDLMNVERAIGRFDFARSEGDMRSFFNRLDAFVAKEEKR